MQVYPDRIIVLPEGKIYFVETKRPKGKTRILQDKQMEFLKKLGFETRVISTMEGIKNFISEVRENGKGNI